MAEFPEMMSRTMTTTSAPLIQESSAAPSRAKRMGQTRVFGLRTFLNPGCPADFAGAFRDNIRAFLRECAEVEGGGYTLRGMPVWSTLLVDEKSGAAAPLYTVEECVRHSPRPLCDQCRCSGWSHHMVSRRRYHLLIPLDEDWDRETLRTEALDLHNHILHGIIHCNGFGHLLCINGRDGGSRFISGADVMDLWDRLCVALRVREITVDDSSRKKSMELRLLLPVAQGTTWFGRWGYTFRLGSFGVTWGDYRNAVELLASLGLDHLIDEMGKIGREVDQFRRIISCYRRLAEFDSSGLPRLASLGDLLRCLLGLKRHRAILLPASHAERRPGAQPPQKGQRRCRNIEAVAAESGCRWPPKRVRLTAQVVVGALEGRRGGMSRQEVRDEVRLSIGDTGLIDYVLKSIGDCVVGGRVVRRAQNPATRVLQFSLDDVPSGAGGGVGPVLPSPPPLPSPESRRAVTWPSVAQVERDIAWVYRHVLLRARPRAAEVLLCSRRWAKGWGLRDEEDDWLRFLCGWMPGEQEQPLRRVPPPPPEVLVLPPYATFGDLLAEAGKAMRDTYCAMEGFRELSVEGVAGDDWEPLLCGAESGGQVGVRGVGAKLTGGEGRLVYEGGEERWTVRCGCGARDDDGERMVACDICEVWQHTRCAGIADGDAVPPLFICGECGRTVIQLRHSLQRKAAGAGKGGEATGLYGLEGTRGARWGRPTSRQAAAAAPLVLPMPALLPSKQISSSSSPAPLQP